MESKEICEKIINSLNGKYLQGSSEPLLVKFADGGPKKTKPGWLMNQKIFIEKLHLI